MKLLFVFEGVADGVFFRDYIGFITKGRLELERVEIKQNGFYTIYKSNDNHLEFLLAGGCTELENVNPILTERQDSGYEIIIIQDCDSEAKDVRIGGYENRINFFKEFMDKYGLEFEYFLLPNNRDDGDLEGLLLSIANMELFNKFSTCYGAFYECIENIDEQTYHYELQNDKQVVFQYIQAFNGKSKAKERERMYENGLWDMSSAQLTPLLQFISVHLNKFIDSVR